MLIILFLSDLFTPFTDYGTITRYQSRMKTLEMKEEIQKIIESNNIVLFMKGTPQRPECGFSGAVVQVLKLYDVEYHSENMNKDTMMKEALKEYSDWPTIPQLYVNGKFIGGSDIVLNYHKNHEFQDVLDGKL
ncbi:predicted protein [Naegleria gruberi]|uniref:Predicted protein n=1 Tax=Naegleria gruberi TaxID=5762 RepID=D2UYT0_NAEGR|nr:uncharacterized protein NAEGRDRAFT_29135 [Naegleria gruberi]EFC50535.1 predicted protein [Naegleria gruberi]|eukprot:XP_002683279.1 predicted protein [Naegleria gruberi strain NEG-M]